LQWQEESLFQGAEKEGGLTFKTIIIGGNVMATFWVFIWCCFLVLAIGVYFIAQAKKETEEMKKLEYGDFESYVPGPFDRPRPCPRCGGWSALYLRDGDMDKCTDCGCIHR
jgi:hypothetical protein